MAPIDYSKWDNIDTDSEDEAPPPSRPAPKADPSPVKPAATPATSVITASTTATGPIQAVMVTCEGDRGPGCPHPWGPTTVDADHPVFSATVPPIPSLIEVPLVFHRVGSQFANRADLDNQMVTYMNIDTEYGLAPPAWQSGIGTVIAARKDKKPLLPHHLEGVWMYCDRILDLFGDGDAPRRMFSRASFERWWRGYVEEQKGFRGGRGGEEDPEDWRAVRSPYEV